MLDDKNVLKQRDSSNILEVVTHEYEQVAAETEVVRPSDGFTPANIVVAALGGSALAAEMARDWLQLPIPLEIVRGYEVPAYVSEHTLVIAISYSGGTEETLSAVVNAEAKNAKVAVISSGGRLMEIADEKQYPAVVLPQGMQPRMGVIYNLRALVALLESYGLVGGALAEMAANASWLENEMAQWHPDVPEADNYAKQLAQKAIGKTTVVYGGKMAAVAHKWKVAVNENAKNLAFYNELPEYCHNEFTGWTSHPVEKPFAVFDLVSGFDHSQVKRRFEIMDRLLSGKRPKAITISMQGDNLIAQMLWGAVLSDYVSVYMAILNNVDPTALPLVDKMKKELSD